MATYSVIGLARSGVAAANALVGRGHRVIASDLHNESKLSEFLSQLSPAVEVVLEKNHVEPGSVVVVSPGIPLNAPIFPLAAETAERVVGEIGLFYELKGNVPVLAVTGTDGKSTTTSWLGSMCRAAQHPTWIGGNLGIPLCASLDELTAAHIVVAEVSCFQLSTAPNFHPQVAIITNIAPDHLDYYGGSFEAYKAAKAAVMQNHGPKDTVVLNGDDPILADWKAPNGGQTLWFSRQGSLKKDQQGLWLDGTTIVYGGDGMDTIPVVEQDELQIPGMHNVENAMAATAAAFAYGLPLNAIQQSLRTFGGLEHRIEYVTSIQGVRFYNDSKATNPHASEAALRAFDEPIILICGGSEKGSDFGPWSELVVERCHHVVCCGDTGQRIQQALGDRVPSTLVGRLEEATERALQLANGSGLVVLSPACASFDQFRNFEERGRQFKQMVKALHP